MALSAWWHGPKWSRGPGTAAGWFRAVYCSTAAIYAALRRQGDTFATLVVLLPGIFTGTLVWLASWFIVSVALWNFF